MYCNSIISFCHFDFGVSGWFSSQCHYKTPSLSLSPPTFKATLSFLHSVKKQHISLQLCSVCYFMRCMGSQKDWENVTTVCRCVYVHCFYIVRQEYYRVMALCRDFIATCAAVWQIHATRWGWLTPPLIWYYHIQSQWTIIPSLSCFWKVNEWNFQLTVRLCFVVFSWEPNTL